MRDLFYKRMFLAGAWWNLLGGVAILFLTRRIFGWANLARPHPPLYYYAWIALFMTFGIGYWMVATDPYGNRNIVILGIVGKLAFAAIFIWYMVAHRGDVPRFFLVPVIGDLVFVALFWMFLCSSARDTNPGKGTR